MEAWQTLESELVLDNPVLRVKKLLRRQADGRAGQFVVLDSPDWVNVIPITQDGQVVLIRQWRHGSQETTLEIPGGLVDPGESPSEAGARELMEETGYQAQRLIPLGRVQPNPALFTNHCYTFLAPEVKLRGPQHTDPHEEIEVLTVPVGQLPELVRSGQIDHCVVIAALAFYWLGGPGLAPQGEFVPSSDDA